MTSDRSDDGIIAQSQVGSRICQVAVSGGERNGGFEALADVPGRSFMFMR